MFTLQNHNVNDRLNQRIVKPIMSTNYVSYHPPEEKLFTISWGHLNSLMVFSAYAERLLRKHTRWQCHWLNH